ncbi:MAG: ABC transporter substrate-binding protein [Halodesulfovibrio sp.]|uniref:ABC transporter substrate-binding protein n=1 Tax=Halodesulfovibrio sp. TaxID=1912772 RepID=UPI00359D481F
MKQFVQYLFLTSVACFILSICSIVQISYASPPYSSEQENASPQKGGTLVVALNSTPAHLNPAVHSGTLTGLVGTQLFAGLVRYGKDGIIYPYLAKSWEWSNNNHTLILHLRKNATFHDDTPITSSDVAFSIETVSKYHPFFPMLAALQKIETPDAYTVILKLKNYHPALLRILTPVLTPILPKHIYGDGQNIRTHPANWNVVGSGPFQLAANQPKNHILLTRFKNFFIPNRPYLDTIDFKLFQGPDEIPMAMENGEVHVTGFSPLEEHHNQLKKQKHLLVTTEGLDGIRAMAWLGLNLQRPPFNDSRVRQALALTIDKNFITHKIFRGNSRTMDGPLPADNPFYAPSEKPHLLNIEQANKLLDEAGFKRNATGKRMTLQVTYPPNASALAIPLLKYLRHRLSRTVGIDLIIEENYDFLVWSKQIASGKFNMTFDIVFSWEDPVIGVHRTYHSTNAHRNVLWSNTLGYSNPKVDELLDAAAKEPDTARRKEIYAQFQQIVREDQPIIWLGTMPYTSIIDGRLRGINNSRWGLLSPMDTTYWVKQQ